MVRWIDALAKTRNKIVSGFRAITQSKGMDNEESLEEFEEMLIAADIPVRLVGEWIQQIETKYRGLKISRHDILREMLSNALSDEGPSFTWNNLPEKPYVILVVGVNGSGKTTTCAKLAHQAKQAGLQPMLGATDTFRAAGSDQLKLWAEKIGCDVVGGKQGADAAAVAYDTMDAAVARGSDVVIIDTAGRMHTKQPLMQELDKVRRSIGKRVPGAPQEIWVVLDAMIGKNATRQAEVFHGIVPLTGAVVSKLDGSSKAGFVFAVHKELGVPVRMAGLGEGEDDLVPFDASEFVNALMGSDNQPAV